MADMEIDMDVREFQRAMAEIASESDRTDYEIVTMNSQTLVRSLVYNTPRDTGTARAGFWPAWESLGMSGSPGTRRGAAPFKKGRRTYVPSGKVTDKRTTKGDPYFELVNKSHYVDGAGQKVYYPYILNARVNFWGEGLREAAFKFGKGYERLLKKHGKL